MTRSLTIRLALACGVASIAWAAPAVAEEGVAFKNLLGSMGVIPKEKDAIAYRERAPLVLPPGSTLPAPVTSTAVSDPNWPKDPDVAARRRRAAEQRSPVTWSETRRAQENNGERLTPAELQAGRVATHQAHAPRDSYGDARSGGAAPVMPNELMAVKKTDDAESQPGVEPARTALTDPPGGYRKSNGQAGKYQQGPRIDQQERDASPINWLTRRFTGANDDD